MSLQLTPSSLVNALKEFLTSWINAVFYERNLYPKEAFTNLKSFDLACFFSRNPQLNKYISDFIDDLIQKLSTGKVNKLSLVLFSTSDLRIRERYVLTFGEMISFMNFDFVDKDEKIEGITWESVYPQFRSMLNSHLVELRRLDLPVDFNFKFKLMLEIDNSMNLNPEFNWVLNNSKSSAEKEYLSIDKFFVGLNEISCGILRISSNNEYVTYK